MQTYYPYSSRVSRGLPPTVARALRAREAVADLPDVSDAGLPRGDTRPREFRSRVNRIVLFSYLFVCTCLSKYCLPRTS